MADPKNFPQHPRLRSAREMLARRYRGGIGASLSTCLNLKPLRPSPATRTDRPDEATSSVRSVARKSCQSCESCQKRFVKIRVNSWPTLTPQSPQTTVFHVAREHLCRRFQDVRRAEDDGESRERRRADGGVKDVTPKFVKAESFRPFPGVPCIPATRR